MQGTVKWFNEKKGFGFIESEGYDYFVHYKSIKESGYKTLSENMVVNFTPTDGSRGKSAIDVSIKK